MTSTMRDILCTVPKVDKSCHIHTGFDDACRAILAHKVVELAFDAVVGHSVSRPERVGVVCERPIRDTQGVTDTIATKTVFSVKDRGICKVTSIKVLYPVTAGFV